jgi:mitochondrial fission protein ELM1
LRRPAVRAISGRREGTLASDDILTAWALTTGEAGMRTQARGLARAVADEVIEKVSPVRRPWRWARSGWLMRKGLAADADPITPPWPDLIVSSGRRSALLAREAKRLAGGTPLLVHVQDPRTGVADFDLVVAMAHDAAEGPNVMHTLTALHDVTPQRLAAAGKAWGARLTALPRPLTGLILGGPAGAGGAFGVAEATNLLAQARRLIDASGGSLAVVPSRRTPDAVIALFVDAQRADPRIWTWPRTGENPYLGVLALADRLVVTGDSVSMVSEALATPHPVEVFAGQLRPRHRRFLDALLSRGLIRLFDGQWTDLALRAPIDATAEAAAAVRVLLQARR